MTGKLKISTVWTTKLVYRTTAGGLPTCYFRQITLVGMVFNFIVLLGQMILTTADWERAFPTSSRKTLRPRRTAPISTRKAIRQPSTIKVHCLIPWCGMLAATTVEWVTKHAPIFPFSSPSDLPYSRTISSQSRSINSSLLVICTFPGTPTTWHNHIVYHSLLF